MIRILVSVSLLVALSSCEKDPRGPLTQREMEKELEEKSRQLQGYENLKREEEEWRKQEPKRNRERERYRRRLSSAGYLEGLEGTPVTLTRNRSESEFLVHNSKSCRDLKAAIERAKEDAEKEDLHDYYKTLVIHLQVTTGRLVAEDGSFHDIGAYWCKCVAYPKRKRP